MATKLISWNVNGIRAAIKKDFMGFLAEHDPDILCLQEIKAMQEQVTDPFPDHYHAYWNSADKKGYSGTAVFSKIEPLSVRNGIGIPEHDGEGRVITLEFDDYHLVTVYTPNAQNELRRLPYRQQWDRDFLAYVSELEASKPVIFCGDQNVSHKEIDLARPKANRGSPGFSDEERSAFDEIVAAGYVDSFRSFCSDADEYSWWSYRAGARKNNVGWRLDYFCVSETLAPRMEDAFILQEVLGSDHCPVGLLLK
jgi:exodeoxyribonuclease-3